MAEIPGATLMKTTDASAEARKRLAPRHKPQQDRSRVRLQALLDAAEQVVAESGLQGLAMREVARRANLPIASVYHYFPSTAALVRALLEQQFENMNGILENGLKSRFPMDTAEFSIEQVKALIDDVAAYFFTTPSATELLAGLHAYPDFRTLNIEDTKKNAAFLEPVLTHFFLKRAPERASMTAIVLVEWVSATLRFATASPPDVRVKIVDTLKTLVALALKGLAETEESTRADPDSPPSKQVKTPPPTGKSGRRRDRPALPGKK
jgi:AcrR family transcriptional regulator